jgi:hypothetical protein
MQSDGEQVYQWGAVAHDVADARAGVVTALARMERGERDSLDVLRDALCSYVTALKAEGASRDDALEAVRQVISEPATVEGTFRLLAPAREALIELSTHWCAEEYNRS